MRLCGLEWYRVVDRNLLFLISILFDVLGANRDRDRLVVEVMDGVIRSSPTLATRLHRVSGVGTLFSSETNTPREGWNRERNDTPKQGSSVKDHSALTL